jgi:hypothetical protein
MRVRRGSALAVIVVILVAFVPLATPDTAGAMGGPPSGSFVLPEGFTGTFSAAGFNACDALTWGYILDVPGEPQPQASKPFGCSSVSAPTVTIGPFQETVRFEVYLTDDTCGKTYYSDGSPVDHVIVDGNGPYNLRFADSGGADCGQADVVRYTPPGFNFEVTYTGPTCRDVLSGSIPKPGLSEPHRDPDGVKRYAMINTTFQPRGGLAAAAQICNVQAFSWQQSLEALPSPSPFKDVDGNPLSAPPSFLDPPPGGYKDKPSDAYPFAIPPDVLPTLTLDDTAVSYYDDPEDACLPGFNTPIHNALLQQFCQNQEANGPQMSFRTSVVGIDQAGQPVPLPIGDVTWSSTFNGTSGGISLLVNELPPDPDSGTGGITITGTDSATLDHIVLSPQSSQLTAGTSLAYTAEGFDQANNDLGNFTDWTTFTISPDGSCTNAVCTATTSGPHTVTGTDNGVTATASLPVRPGPLDHLSLSPVSTTVPSGASVTYKAEGFDLYNNDIGDVTRFTSFTIGQGGTCTGLASGPPNIGNATCSSSAAGNHTVTGMDTHATGTATLTVTGTVTPANLTVTGPTATMTYGSALPPLPASYGGFANGDTPASLTSPATCTTTARSASPPGTYPVTCSGAVDPNYTIGYVAGALTINPATLTVTGPTATMAYGSALPPLPPTYSGFANGDTPASLTTPATCTTTATFASPPGTYPVTCSGAVDANYTTGYVAGSLTVTPANLTVTADNMSIAYGDALPTLTYHVTGFQNGDTSAVLAGNAACGTSGPSGSPPGPAGTYAISCAPGTLTAGPNYTLSFASGTLTINKKTATLGYTGSLLVSTGSTSASTANVTLQATITPASGGSPDLTKAAPVTLLLYKSTNLTMSTPDASCTATTVSSAGVASCVVSSLGLDNWTVIVQEPTSNGYFTALPSDPVVLTVYQPATDKFATGGGWVNDRSSTVSPQNPHGNFGLTVRYKSGTTTPTGQSVYAFRGADGYDYVMKSNSWTGGGLSIGTNTASFSGKANVTAINPTTGLAVTGIGGGNYTYRVDVTDNGTTGDTYAISVYAPTGALFHQAGTTATQLQLGGGNIAIHTQ